MPAVKPADLGKIEQDFQALGAIPSTMLKEAPVSSAMDKEAQAWADKLMEFDHTDAAQAKAARASAENVGLDTQTRLAKKSDMLKQQINVLAKSAEGSPVANALLGLKVQVDELNPHVQLTEPGFLGRMAQKLPFVGSPMNKYLSKWQASGSVIDSIVVQLREGAQQLIRDIEVLTDDQIEMRGLTLKQQRTIQTAMLLDQKLEANIAKLEEGERKKFLQEEVLYPLRQRIQDLQQSLLVNQQGVISYEIIIRNNRELVRSAKRCEEVTIRALETAVVIALALNNQRIVLKTIQAIDETTARLLVQNSQQLRTQGVEIHKQASGLSIPVEAMKQSFTDLIAAMDDVERFKQEALPQMAGRIQEMNRLAGQAEAVISRMEKGNQNRPAIALDLESTGPVHG